MARPGQPFAFANFETTLAMLNKAMGFGKKENALVFTAVGVILLVRRGLSLRDVTKRADEVLGEPGLSPSHAPAPINEVK